MEIFTNIAYIASAILFIFGIKMLGRADTARRGNLLSSSGMLLAVLATLIGFDLNYTWIGLGLVIGGLIGFFWAKKVQMTGMPELVAIFNGFGGLASLLVGWAEFAKISNMGWAKYLIQNPSAQSEHFVGTVLALAIVIGGITFTGSLVAFLKLSGKLSGTFSRPNQKLINAGVAGSLFLCSVLFAAMPSGTLGLILFLLIVLLALVLGVFGTLPIGGGDMPVVIALLNSLSGLAASAAGFVIFNNVLIVAGCLVGASGLILTIIMCKAMNRTITNVLFGSFGAATGKTGTAVEGEMKAISTQDAYFILEAANTVVFVPGYGMAVAQAQHAVKELGEILENNGAEVFFAVHPVAGRMPGHMNVLLAEADVDYDKLREMDDVNPIMPNVDVAIVIGANDVVNPAASDDPSSPIYGMPIINVHQAQTVFALKRGKGTGFSGLENALFFRENCRMLYGDAKETVAGLVAEFDK